MIDINLFGKKQKAEPEITPIKTPALRAKAERPGRTGRIFSLKTILLLVIAVAILLSVWRYREDIVRYGKDIVAYVKTLIEEQPEPVVQEPETEQPPPVEQLKPGVPETGEEPAAEPAATAVWDYGRSIEHINAYTAMVGLLPPNADYNIIAVCRNSIVSEIETVDDTQMFDIETAIRRNLPMYSFNFMPKGRLLQVFSGTLKPDTELPEVTPSEEYSTPEANRNAINSLLKLHKLTIEEQSEATPNERENVLFLPVWMKFSGKEADILKFLTDIKEKGLSINITKISGQSKNRSESNETAGLNFDFDIIR